jgi:hypothetical protein
MIRRNARTFAQPILSIIEPYFNEGKHMRRLLVCTLMAALIGVIDVQMAAAAGADPVVGTWKLNPGKSTFKSGPAITNQTRTYSQSGDEITLDMKSVSADGKKIDSHTTYRLDGKSYPVTGSPDYDNLIGKRLNSHMAQFTLKKGDKVIGRSTRTVSKDGKKLTSRIHETLASGDKSDNVLVFDKQ